MNSRYSGGAAYVVWGMLFATLGVVAIVNAYTPLSLTTVGIVFASAFMLAGLVGLVAALRRPGG
ncbi:MAG TPA: hypothetical protein H9881_09125 [Candidatus Stackebrandtia excrementipullorum]|nr:hypothetical protein [Candidatus Stackebrandtia excrementipullorum]